MAKVFLELSVWQYPSLAGEHNPCEGALCGKEMNNNVPAACSLLPAASPSFPSSFCPSGDVPGLVKPEPASQTSLFQSCAAKSVLGHSFYLATSHGWAGAPQSWDGDAPQRSRLAPQPHGAGPCTFAREIPATGRELQLLGSQLGAAAA